MSSEKIIYYCVVVTESVSIVLYELWKKCFLLFDSNSLKVSVMFDMNSGKSVYYCFGSNSMKVSLSFDMNSGKSV